MSHVEFLQIPGDFNQIELPPYYERESSVHMPKAHPSDHTYTNTLTHAYLVQTKIRIQTEDAQTNLVQVRVYV